MPSKLSSLFPTSLYTRLYILTCLFETLSDITIELYLFYKVQLSNKNHVDVSSEDTTNNANDNGNTVLPVYLALFVIAHLFQLVLAWEAVVNRNTIQVVGLTIFNAAFLIYAIIQIGEIRDAFASSNISTLVDIIPIVIGVCEAIYIGLTWLIYQEFGWDVYKKIGADRMVKKMFKWYQVFVVVIKFDYFFIIGFSLQILILVIHESEAEKIMTEIAIPASLVILIGGYLAVKYEWKYIMWGFLGGCVAGAVYFVAKIFRIYQKRKTDYSLVFKSLTVFSALSLSLIVVTAWIGVICLRNFGRGLKVHMARASRNKSKIDLAMYEVEEGGYKKGSHYQLDSATNSRMSFD